LTQASSKEKINGLISAERINILGSRRAILRVQKKIIVCVLTPPFFQHEAQVAIGPGKASMVGAKPVTQSKRILRREENQQCSL